MRLEPFALVFFGLAIIGALNEKEPWIFIGFMGWSVGMALAIVAMVNEFKTWERGRSRGPP